MTTEHHPLSESQHRAAVALAEAMIPGNATIPAADETTIARAADVVAHLSPALVRPWAVAQQTLNAAAVTQTGRSFAKLTREKQDALLARWERDPVLRGPLGLLGMLYKMVHFDREPVYRSMGGKFNVVQNLEQPRWLSQVFRAEEWSEPGDLECDVVVVGTGAGGAVVGRELAERGHAVVFLEEGELHRRDSFTGSSLNAHQRFYRGAASVGNAMMPVFMGKLVGGSTAVNGGTCFRAPPWVLDRMCEEMDSDEFTPAALEKYYARVEGILQVGTSDPKRIGRIADVIRRGCDALGWSHFEIKRNAPGCEASGFCDFGCRTDARRSTNISYVPPALERGAMLLTGARADRVIIENGRAVGIEAVAKNGRTIRVRGRAVVFAGGAVPTPLFLQKQGICNTSGQLGRNLTLHPSAGMSGVLDETINGWDHIPQAYAVGEFLRDGVLIIAAQPDRNIAALIFPFTGQRLMEGLSYMPRMASFGVLIRDVARGRVWRDVGGNPAITYNMGREDLALMHSGMVHCGEMLRAAGARRLYPAVLGRAPIDTDRDFARYKADAPGPGDYMLTSYHPLGTCKMGKDPKTSVVGLDNQTHDVKGLFLVDGSTVSGPLGVNPQLTIMAMATRASEKIADTLG